MGLGEKKSLYDRSEAAVVCYMPLSAFPILHFMQKMKPGVVPAQTPSQIEQYWHQ